MPETQLTNLFKTYPINAAALARRIGISEDLIWHYKIGKAVPSEKRLKEIETAIREMGKELAEITLVEK